MVDEVLNEEDAHPRDATVDVAKRVLEDFFAKEKDAVFYLRQITIRFERRFFHWITGKALKELVDEGKLTGGTIAVKDWKGRPLHFFTNRTNRYWKRDAAKIAALVSRFATPDFGKALGNHGETMIDAALPRAGFVPVGRNVKEFGGKRWTESAHDLDRAFSRDGLTYGTEIKNTLDYIPRDEMETKVRMCAHLGLVPLFIVRMAPASYIEFVRKTGGFTLVLEYQLYPFGQDEFAREVRTILGLPVDCPAALQDGTLQRLLNGHEVIKARVNRGSDSQGGGIKVP